VLAVRQRRGVGRRSTGGPARRDRRPRELRDARKPQSYAYDGNGNRTTDERGSHVFNARDQLVMWRRGPEQKIEAGSLVS